MIKKKWFSVFIVICILFSYITVSAENISNSDIIVLYESDVHCAVDGYAKLAALKEEMKKNTEYVSIVSSGDFIQGSSLGALSQGSYIIDIMNHVGYDVVTLGNHEFDYKMPRLIELMTQLNASVVSCNFVDNTGKAVYEPYTILSYGDVDVAYLGITTPESITKSTPAYFQNENGEYIYDFCGETLYDTVQRNIDNARKDGADYVIVLSHLGSEYVTERWNIKEVIANTSGIDVVLDGHSHSVIASNPLKNKNGENVLLSSTGTKFENVGKLQITANGEITTELIPLENYQPTDSKTAEYIAQIQKEYDSKTSNVIGKSDVKLTTLYENGTRAIRSSETNLGDFCADAYREVLDADIGFMNGGGIRADIEIGDITYSDILSVYPWNNQVCSAKVTGNQILDALEFAVSRLPIENGGFQQVSGITFDVDITIPSPVVRDEKEMFTEIRGQRRVQNVKVFNKETNQYEEIDPQKQYVLAAHSYLLKDCGDGFTMFKDVELIKDCVMLDVELMQNYIQNNNNGVIGQEYAQSQDRIKISDIPLRKTFEDMGMNVEWQAPDTAVVTYNNENVIFKIGNDEITIGLDGEKTLEMTQPAQLIHNTIYIPYDAVVLLGSISE